METLIENEIKEINPFQSEIDGIHERIRKLYATRDFLRKNGQAIKDLNLTVDPFIYDGNEINFRECSHEESIKVMRAFPGKWIKTYNDSSIDYKRDGDRDFTLLIWKASPPNTCRLIAYEVEEPEKIIPAQKVKKFKLECKQIMSAEEIQS